MLFNIIATIGTAEVELAPYPGGLSTVPSGKVRKIYMLIATNTATTTNTLTLRVYRGDVVEKSLNIIIPASSTISITSRVDSPVLILPGNRTIRAVATASSVDLVLTCYDE